MACGEDKKALDPDTNNARQTDSGKSVVFYESNFINCREVQMDVATKDVPGKEKSSSEQ